jgi:single-strand DNA-binding protein
MSSNNSVIIGGRLTRDPELKTTQSGKAIANFSIAINHSKEKVSFINCNAWEKIARDIAAKFKKGSYIKISGAIYQNRWTDKEGIKKSDINVTASELIKTYPNKKDEVKQSEPKAQPHSEPTYNKPPEDDEFPDFDKSGDVPF